MARDKSGTTYCVVACVYKSDPRMPGCLALALREAFQTHIQDATFLLFSSSLCIFFPLCILSPYTGLVIQNPVIELKQKKRKSYEPIVPLLSSGI